MAVLKYKNSNGNYLDIVGVNVQNEVVQTTGQSTTAVMSQKAVSDLIPAQASLSNQLADKDFVNSSVSTATATYQGSYNLVSDLKLTIQASHGTIELALNTAVTSADNNDYSFVQIPTADSTPTEIASVERYKYNGTTWSYEYAINNSGFTAAQWAAVNSNITSGLVAQLNAFSNNPQTSISKLFGMDANGNFQNISTGNLKSVLGVNVLPNENLKDADTINKNCAMHVNSASYSSLHLPDRYGLFICLMRGTNPSSGYTGVQLFFNGSKALFRIKTDTTWNTWNQLN